LDADVQYRPLFNDGSAVSGQQYWYRIVARNGAGDSEPSNVVGPAVVASRTLVDECRDLSLTATIEGKVLPASENARTVQEDCHRLALHPGSAIIYRVKEPISRWNVYSFAPAEANLEFSVSADGKNYKSVTVHRTAYPSGQTIYGYLTPILFSGELVAENATYLRIASPGALGLANSKNESSPKREHEPETIELSRVEIEYGRAAGAVAPVKQAPRQATQINSALFVDSTRPLDVTLAAIDAAANRGERQLNVVVTVLVDLSDNLRIKSFGGFDPSTHQYKTMDEAMHKKLGNELRQIFARMVERDMAIYILPHIDAGGKVRQWRNWVNFDPLESYSGYSYSDLMLGTITDALAETTKPKTHIEMALSGEMGTSLFRYPESYRKIIRQLRARPQLEQLKLGISLNHGGIAGKRNPTGAKDVQLSGDKRQQMQVLIDDCDFVGMSFYAPVTVSPTPDDFVRGIDRFMGEFKQHGLSVPTTKPMQFSEVGIGGGRLRFGEDPDPSKAVQSPWEGTANPRNNPWRDDAMRSLRRQYHSALIQFLSQQPAQWRVSAVFFWSMGSWDPINPRQPEFADPEIIAAIEKHNRSVSDSRP
jgi:hypothetical protein